MPRTDSGAAAGECMRNQQGCEGHSSRRLCCPPGDVLPWCGWYGHRNGHCEPSDLPSNTFEIGSNNMYCRRGGDQYQVAACTWSSPAVLSHQTCYWSQDFPSCNRGSCDSTDSQLFSSFTGSGGAFCMPNQSRKYCCIPQKNENHDSWTDCGWYDNIGIVPDNLRSGTCLGGCPDDKVPLGLDYYGGNYCKCGARAQYCRPGRKTVKRELSDEDQGFDYYLGIFLNVDNGRCSRLEHPLGAIVERDIQTALYKILYSVPT